MDSAADVVSRADTDGEPENDALADASLDALVDPVVERDADADADTLADPEFCFDAVDSVDAVADAVPRPALSAPLADTAALAVGVAQDDAVARIRPLGEAAEETVETPLRVPTLEPLASTDALVPADDVAEATVLRDALEVEEAVPVVRLVALSLGDVVAAIVVRALPVVNADALGDREPLPDADDERGGVKLAVALAHALALAVPTTDAVLDRVAAALPDAELHALPRADADAVEVEHADIVKRASVDDTVAVRKGGDGDALALTAREADTTSDPDGAAREGVAVPLSDGDADDDGELVPAADVDADGDTDCVARGERVVIGDCDAVGEPLIETLPNALAVSVCVGIEDDDARADPDTEGVADAHGDAVDSVVVVVVADGKDDCDGDADAESNDDRVAASVAVAKPVDDENGDSLFAGLVVAAPVVDVETLALLVPVEDVKADAEPVDDGAPLFVAPALTLDDSHAVAELTAEADAKAVFVVRGDAEYCAEKETRSDVVAAPEAVCAPESLAIELAVNDLRGVRDAATVSDDTLDCEPDALFDVVARGDVDKRAEPLTETDARTVAETDCDPDTDFERGAVREMSGESDAAIDDDGEDDCDGDAEIESFGLTVGAALPDDDAVWTGLALALALGEVDADRLLTPLSEDALLGDAAALVLAVAQGVPLLDSLRIPDADAETDALPPGVALSLALADTDPLTLGGAVADDIAEAESNVLALGLAVDELDGVVDCVADADGDCHEVGDAERVPCALGERMDDTDAALLAVEHADELTQADARGELVGSTDAESTDDGETRGVAEERTETVRAPLAVADALGLATFVAVPPAEDGDADALGLEIAVDDAKSEIVVVDEPDTNAVCERAAESVPFEEADALTLAVELSEPAADTLPRADGEVTTVLEMVALAQGDAVHGADGESGGVLVPSPLTLTTPELVGGALEAVATALAEDDGQLDAELDG